MSSDLDRLGKIVDRGDNDFPRGYPGSEREAQLIDRYAGLGGRDVLEVGCGNGRLTVEGGPPGVSRFRRGPPSG